MAKIPECDQCGCEIHHSSGSRCCEAKPCKVLICATCLDQLADNSPKLQSGAIRCRDHRVSCAECGFDIEIELAQKVGNLTVCRVCPAEVAAGADGRRIVLCEGGCKAVVVRASCVEVNGALCCTSCRTVQEEPVALPAAA